MCFHLGSEWRGKVSWDFVATVLLSCGFEFHIYTYCTVQKTSNLKINAEPLRRGTLVVWLYGIPTDKAPLILSSLLKVIKLKKNWQCLKHKLETQETAEINSQELQQVELLNNKYLILIIIKLNYKTKVNAIIITNIK